MQAVASISASLSEDSATRLFPAIVSALIRAIPWDGLPQNLIYVETVLATFMQLARLVPMLVLQLFESGEADALELLNRVKALKTALAAVTKEATYTAKRAAMAGTATLFVREAYTCLTSLPLYLEELAKEMPQVPRGVSTVSWEAPKREINDGIGDRHYCFEVTKVAQNDTRFEV